MNKSIKSHFLKTGIILLNLILGNRFAYRFLGIINEYFLKHRIKSVFLLYSASGKNVENYVYLWYYKRMKWKPHLVGFFRQDNKFGLIVGISAIEKDFFDKQNFENLVVLEKKVELIRKLVKAETKTFAGVFPGVLFKNKITDNSIERETTARALLEAFDALKSNEKIIGDIPLIVAGSAGFIGSRFVELAKEAGTQEVYGIDVGNKESTEKVFNDFSKERIIFLNITKRGSLADYLSKLKRGDIVLNEVYPEPSEKELEMAKKRGIKIYHIVGIEGMAWPSFPGAYKGGVPCCASFVKPNKKNIVIKKLS